MNLSGSNNLYGTRLTILGIGVALVVSFGWAASAENQDSGERGKVISLTDRLVARKARSVKSATGEAPIICTQILQVGDRLNERKAQYLADGPFLRDNSINRAEPLDVKYVVQNLEFEISRFAEKSTSNPKDETARLAALMMEYRLAGVDVSAAYNKVLNQIEDNDLIRKRATIVKSVFTAYQSRIPLVDELLFQMKKQTYLQSRTVTYPFYSGNSDFLDEMLLSLTEISQFVDPHFVISFLKGNMAYVAQIYRVADLDLKSVVGCLDHVQTYAYIHLDVPN